jgi:hypothetical protein
MVISGKPVDWLYSARGHGSIAVKRLSVANPKGAHRAFAFLWKQPLRTLLGDQLEIGDSGMKWGIPNWREDEEYRDCRTLTSEQWRWEFLRRSAEYRDDWLREAGSPSPEFIDSELLMARYRITEQPNPSLTALDLPPAVLQTPQLRIQRKGRGNGAVHLRDHEAAVIVDLRFPVAPQIKLALAATKNVSGDTIN